MDKIIVKTIEMTGDSDQAEARAWPRGMGLAA